MKETIFIADQFVPTQWDSAEQKAKFANQYIRFILGGFKSTLFPKWFYTRLSMCFGMIAHYDQGGFYDYYFSSLSGQTNFISECLRHPCYGDPTFVYSDVERSLQNWLKENKILEKVQSFQQTETDKSEYQEFLRLKAKFEPIKV